VGVSAADDEGATGARKAAKGIRWKEQVGRLGERDEGSDGGECGGVHGDGGGLEEGVRFIGNGWRG